MSFNDKTDQMDWKDEAGWALISVFSGLMLSLLYDYFQTFPNSNIALVAFCCSLAFYILSILVRIQNKRGMVLTGKPAYEERALKFIFPLLGFAVGIAILFA